MNISDIYNTLVEQQFKNNNTQQIFIAGDMEDFDDCRFISYIPKNDELVSKMITIDFPGSEDTPEDSFVIKKFVKVNEPLELVARILITTEDLLNELIKQIQQAIDSYEG